MLLVALQQSMSCKAGFCCLLLHYFSCRNNDSFFCVLLKVFLFFIFDTFFLEDYFFNVRLIIFAISVKENILSNLKLKNCQNKIKINYKFWI